MTKQMLQSKPSRQSAESNSTAGKHSLGHWQFPYHATQLSAQRHGGRAAETSATIPQENPTRPGFSSTYMLQQQELVKQMTVSPRVVAESHRRESLFHLRTQPQPKKHLQGTAAIAQRFRREQVPSAQRQTVESTKTLQPTQSAPLSGVPDRLNSHTRLSNRPAPFQAPAVVQRFINIVDESQDDEDVEDYTSHVEAVLAHPEFASEAGLRQSTTIHLIIRIVRAEDHPQQHASTILSGHDEHPSQQWSDILRDTSQITFTITIFPSTLEGKGEIMAHLMHEIILHLRAKMVHLGGLHEQRGDVQEHVMNIVQGGPEQHSNPAIWRVYLAKAQIIGGALKDDDQIEEGSDLIMSAVNDVMTHMATPQSSPNMTVEERTALFQEADQIGNAEELFRQAHQDIWWPQTL